MRKTLAINGGTPVRTEIFPGYNTIGAEEEAAVIRVLRSGVLSKFLGCWDEDFYGGPEVRALEAEWATYFGAKHAVAVNSATSGLYAAVGASGISPGDEIIVSPYTMSASATAAIVYGAVPVFADVEEDYFCLDARRVEELITERTKAIIVVDLLGLPFDVDGITALARKYDLKVIEDCAQAPGARFAGRFAGTLADLGVYSLNYHKHIHTGEGGIVVTDDDLLAERVRLIRNHAEAVVDDMGVEDITNMVGFNFRMTEMEAAVGREQLKKLPHLIEIRQLNAEYLSKGLSGLNGIEPPRVRSGATHAYYVMGFRFDEEKLGIDRHSFIAAVKAELPVSRLRETDGVLISEGYVKPLYLSAMYQRRIAFGRQGYPFTMCEHARSVSYARGICPVAEKLHEKELFMTELMRPGMSRPDLDDVIEAFNKVYEYRSELQSSGR